MQFTRYGSIVQEHISVFQLQSGDQNFIDVVLVQLQASFQFYDRGSF